VAGWLGPAIPSLAMRLAFRARPFNLVVTNVPGPQLPLYMLEARMVDVYPQVPLFPEQGLGVALISYDGRLHWGFNADSDLLPDLHDFVESVQASFDELCAAAELPEAGPGARPAPSTPTGAAPRAPRSGLSPRIAPRTEGVPAVAP
jgi:diacylglycerol O-acyltransferase / wax synthase